TPTPRRHGKASACPLTPFALVEAVSRARNRRSPANRICADHVPARCQGERALDLHLRPAGLADLGVDTASMGGVAPPLRGRRPPARRKGPPSDRAWA